MSAVFLDYYWVVDNSEVIRMKHETIMSNAAHGIGLHQNESSVRPKIANHLILIPPERPSVEHTELQTTSPSSRLHSPPSRPSKYAAHHLQQE
jgi:hypothetical protein